MAFCAKCGTKIEEGVRFCPNCGAQIGASTYSQSQQESAGQQGSTFHYSNQGGSSGGSAAGTSDFDPTDVSQNKAMGILAYFSLLALIPLFSAKNSEYARFHANQGLILLIVEVAITVLSRLVFTVVLSALHLFWAYQLLKIVFDLLSLCCLGLSIYGIVNAAQGKRKELPIIGKFQILK